MKAAKACSRSALATAWRDEERAGVKEEFRRKEGISLRPKRASSGWEWRACDVYSDWSRRPRVAERSAASRGDGQVKSLEKSSGSATLKP